MFSLFRESFTLNLLVFNSCQNSKPFSGLKVAKIDLKIAITWAVMVQLGSNLTWILLEVVFQWIWSHFFTYFVKIWVFWQVFFQFLAIFSLKWPKIETRAAEGGATPLQCMCYLYQEVFRYSDCWCHWWRNHDILLMSSSLTTNHVNASSFIKVWSNRNQSTVKSLMTSSWGHW